jgi:dienelactone hydrolase
MRTLVAVVCLLAVICWSIAADAQQTRGGSSFSPETTGLLELKLRSEIGASLSARREDFLKIKSRAECEAWARERREFFERQIGGFPERTPLNARVVRRLQGDGYRVENVIFESRPQHHVTANLYLPEGDGPFPGVIVPCGHSHNGKAADGYQRASILLAKHGIAALCYDPIGQGERYQMLDFEHEHEHFEQVSYPLAVPHPRVQYLCTTEHTTMGIGCILLGTNVAQYRIWDGMRAIDYLQSRSDIIEDRIGCTGNSGGGTLTAYLMALDDRIFAAAPVCYLTTFRRLIETKGPQDAEQNIFGQIAFGMDEPDYVMMRAPRPTLICAGRRDATFNIDDTWDLFRESKMFYSRLGFPERVDLNDADVPHGFYLQQREAVARFMHRWLLGKDKVIHEIDPASLPDPVTDQQLRDLGKGDWTQEDLYCTPEGQTLLMKGEKSVFQLNTELAQQLKKERTPRWQAMSDAERRELVRATIGASSKSDLPAPVVKSVRTIDRDGFSIHQLILKEASPDLLPVFAYVPDKPNGEVCLYLHGEGLDNDTGAGEPIAQRVNAGQIVIAAELTGIGLTETGKDGRDWARGKFGPDLREILMAYLLGRSYVGMRANDVAVLTQFLADYEPVKAAPEPRRLHLVATGEAAIPALHGAALQSDKRLQFSTVTLRGMVPSWEHVVAAPDHVNQLVNAVHGALRHYDLQDLVDLAGRERVALEAPVDALGNPFTVSEQQ